MANLRPLTPKQEAFVREYLVDRNATAAAERAGYSQHTAYAQGSRLLKNAEVRQAVAEGAKRHADAVDISAEHVLRGLKTIADDTSEETRDRLKALELLGKYLKLFTDKVDVSGEVSVRVIDPYAEPRGG